MEKYEPVEIEVIMFNGEDVITTSPNNPQGTGKPIETPDLP